MSGLMRPHQIGDSATRRLESGQVGDSASRRAEVVEAQGRLRLTRPRGAVWLEGFAHPFPRAMKKVLREA